jgi:hypothetical protein
LRPSSPGASGGEEGVMGTQNRRLKPLLYFQNKLFLTTVCEHAIHLEQFRTAIEAIFSDEFRAGRWEPVEIAGSECLSFA